MKSMLLERNRLGMLLFIASEVSFFSILISSYIYFQPVGEARETLHTGITAIYTIFLLSSSFTVWRAGKSAERDNQRMVVIWLGATVALGAVFLVGQVREYAQLLSENITLATSLFGTTFFTLTGFHGLHVLMGLVALSIMLGLAWVGVFRGGRATPVEVLSLYWHFVDVVWIVLFSLIYLWPMFI